jgi:hypothetical protein
MHQFSEKLTDFEILENEENELRRKIGFDLARVNLEELSIEKLRKLNDSLNNL